MLRTNNAACKAILLLAAMTFVVTTAVADVLVTTDGSRIVGTLERLGPDGAIIVTAFAGKLTIPADQVASVTTDEKVNIAFASGDRLIGKLTESSDGARIVIHSEIGDVPVAREKMTAVWPEGADSPDVIALKKVQAEELAAVTPTWTVTLEAGGERKEGNTDTLKARGRLEVKRKTSLDLLTFFMWGEYSEDNDVRSENEYGGGIRYQATLKDHRDYYWYTRLRLEHDEFEDLDLRTTVAAGLGKKWIDKPEHALQTDVGLGYRNESFMDGSDTDSSLLDLGLDYRIDLAPWVQFTHSTDYTPAWDDFDDYRLNFNTALVFPFKSDELKLKVGVRNEYNSRPSGGNDRLDNTYYANVVLSLK